MPMYDFVCECGRIREVLILSSSPAIVKTIACKCKKNMKRVISKSTFHLKGGGWYKDGYQK